MHSNSLFRAGLFLAATANCLVLPRADESRNPDEILPLATRVTDGKNSTGSTTSGPVAVQTTNPFIPVEEKAINATTPSEGSLDGPDNLRLRLIVPTPPTADMPPLVNATVKLNGREWYITELFRTPENAATFPNYTAISYRWYDGRLPNPFFDGFLMSNLTLPSLASAMRNSQQDAFWIDCFSIPATQPLKGAILDLLSNIFSTAHEVIVPLGLESRDTMKFLTNGTDLSTLDATTLTNVMEDLNQEEWVNSIWTYKESLSSKTYTFTDRDRLSYNQTGDGAEPSAKEVSFFNGVSTLSQRYMDKTGLNDFDMRLAMRNVDALVELGLDRTLNSAYERSFFTSMSSLDRRYVESEGNFFWGLYGAITEELMPLDKPSATLADKYDRLFEIAEAKKDYSFIYTSTTRRAQAGRTFYPVSANLDSILNWPTSEAFQTAEVAADGTISLQGMVSLPQQAALGKAGSSFIQQWFQTNVPNITADATDAGVASKVYQIIKQLDFTGSEQPILTTDGLFFPQQAVPAGQNATVLVTSQLGWSFGAPGLAKVDLGNGTTYIPGAFVGSVKKSKAASIAML